MRRGRRGWFMSWRRRTTIWLAKT